MPGDLWRWCDPLFVCAGAIRILREPLAAVAQVPEMLVLEQRLLLGARSRCWCGKGVQVQAQVLLLDLHFCWACWRQVLAQCVGAVQVLALALDWTDVFLGLGVCWCWCGCCCCCCCCY